MHRLDDLRLDKARGKAPRDRPANILARHFLESVTTEGDSNPGDFHVAGRIRPEHSFPNQLVIGASDDLGIGQQFLGIGAIFRHPGPWFEGARRDVSAQLAGDLLVDGYGRIVLNVYHDEVDRTAS
jgi:hypothetical protein